MHHQMEKLCSYTHENTLYIGRLVECRTSELCFNETEGDSLFCKNHMCKLCSKGDLWEGFCLECKCPNQMCEEKAYRCLELCRMCSKRHVVYKERTCEECRCSLKGCGKPLFKRWGMLGIGFLCANHSLCVMKECSGTITPENMRYCKSHVLTTPKLLKTGDLCLKRIGFSKDVRRYILEFVRWKLENQVVCKVCDLYFTKYITRPSKTNTCIKCNIKRKKKRRKT